MAGMDHGGPKKEAGDMPMTAPSLTLSATVKSQLHEVIAAAMSAIGTSPGELGDLHLAYRTLRERVEAVAGDDLSGHAQMQWKEHSMLLGDDGAEGESVKTAAEAVRLADTTRGHVEAMQATFGLMHGVHSMPSPPAVDPEFQKQLGAVIEGYLAVQAALAEDDSGTAAESAKRALEALAGVDMGLVTGKDHMDWMRSAGELKSLLAAVASADGLEPARMKFALLSEQIAALLTRFGVPHGKLYRAWCPMAFDNRGASWIQGQEEISNPYFGDTMLRCGEVKEVLK